MTPRPSVITPDVGRGQEGPAGRTQHGGSTGAPTLGRGVHCGGRPVWCLLVRREQSAQGPSSAWRACCVQEGAASWPPPLGSHTDPWRDASPPVPRGAGLGSPPTTRKETLVAFGWLSGGTMPQGGSGKLQVSVRRGQRSLLTRSRPQEQCLCAARPGGRGGPAEASGSGAECLANPVLCAWPPSLPPRPPVCGGPGNPHLHTCPHLGLGLTPPPSHPPPVTGRTTQTCTHGHQTPPLATRPPKPELVGIRPAETPHDFRQSCQHPPLPRPPRPDPHTHRTETHTTGTQDRSRSSGPSCKASTSPASPLTPEGPHRQAKLLHS